MSKKSSQGADLQTGPEARPEEQAGVSSSQNRGGAGGEVRAQAEQEVSISETDNMQEDAVQSGQNAETSRQPPSEPKPKDTLSVADEMMRRYLDLQQSSVIQEIRDKMAIINLIEDNRVELTTDMSIGIGIPAQEILEHIKTTLGSTNVWGCALRRWFNATESIGKLLKCWSPLRVMCILAGKSPGSPNSYWQLLLDVLNSESMKNHYKRMQLVCNPLAVECGVAARITTRGGPEFAVDRWEGRSFRSSLRTIASALESKIDLEKAGVCVLESTDIMYVFSPEGQQIAADGTSLAPSVQMVENRNIVFDHSVRPLIHMIAETACVRTQAVSPAGLWQMAALITPCAKTATSRAYQLRDFWKALISIEMHQDSNMLRNLFPKFKVMTSSTTFRISMLRVEEWVCLHESGLLEETVGKQLEQESKTYPTYTQSRDDRTCWQEQKTAMMTKTQLFLLW